MNKFFLFFLIAFIYQSLLFSNEVSNIKDITAGLFCQHTFSNYKIKLYNEDSGSNNSNSVNDKEYNYKKYKEFASGGVGLIIAGAILFEVVGQIPLGIGLSEYINGRSTNVVALCAAGGVIMGVGFFMMIAAIGLFGTASEYYRKYKEQRLSMDLNYCRDKINIVCSYKI